LWLTILLGKISMTAGGDASIPEKIFGGG